MGTITIAAGSYAVDSLNDTTAALSIASGASLSIEGAVASTFGQNVTVQSGGALSVGAGASVQIGTGAYEAAVTLTDDGTLTFASGDTVTFDDSNYYTTAQIVVGIDGLMQASGAAFNASAANNSNGGNATAIDVSSGGQLQASSSSFAVGQVSLADGTILNSGDLINNAFNTTLFTPILDVPLLTNNQSFQNVEINSGDSLSSGQSVMLTRMGTVSTAHLLYVLPGNLTISQGASLAVAANVPVEIGVGAYETAVTLTDDGTLTFASGDTVTFDDSNYYTTAQIVVGIDGLMQASGTAFNASAANNSNGGNATAIDVSSGGQLQASSSSFAVGQVSLADGSVLNSGDLTNNVFNTTLFTPILDVPLLTNNQSFQNVEINSGDSLLSGQSVTLTLMGTVSTAHLLYVLPGNLTINQGAFLAVAANVPVEIGVGAYETAVTLTDDGTLTFASGDTVTFDDSNYYTTAQIVVGIDGLMQASNTAFNASAANNSNGGNATAINVSSGGQLQASSSSFAVGQVSLADGTILNSGGLSNNIFNTTLFTPILDVPLLTNNQSFQNVEINPGDSLSSGQSVTLTRMGTVSTAHLLYIFPGNLTINPGGALAVAPNVPVEIGVGAYETAVTLTDDGTLTFASGDTVTFDDSNYYTTAQIVVGSGGLMQASNTAFNASAANNSNGGNATAIDVSSGGQLQASSSSFAVGQVSLADGTILNSGDLTNNVFNTTLFTPILDVPLLTNNQSFQNVEINPGDSLSSGQSVTLTRMGTVSTAHLLYVLPGNLTINQGATLAVAANVPVQIGTGAYETAVTLTDDGTLTFASGDTVTFDDSNYYTTAQIVVGSGGLMQASGAAFNASAANNSNGGNATAINVNSGGQLQASSSSFAVGQVSLAGGSTDTIQFDAFSSQSV